MKITNHIQQNIRTLFVIMSVVLISWGNIQKVKGQDNAYILPNGPYSTDPEIQMILEMLLPSDLTSQIFSTNKVLYDRIYIPISFEGMFIVEVFDKATNLTGLSYTEGYTLANELLLESGQTISTVGGLVNATGKNLYYAAPSDAINMSYWGSPYFNTTTFSSLNTKEFLTSNILPEDFPFTLFNGNNLQIPGRNA